MMTISPLASVLVAVTLATAWGQATTTPTTPDPVQEAVLQQIKRTPAGPVTLDAYAMPDEYLRRVADRLICSDFESRFRIVVRRGAATAPPIELEMEAASSAVPARQAIPYYLAPLLVFVVLFVVVALRRRSSRRR